MTELEIEAKAEVLKEKREDIYQDISDAEQNVRAATASLEFHRKRLARIEAALDDLDKMTPDAP